MMDDNGAVTLPARQDEVATERYWEHVLGGAVLAAVSFAVVLYSVYHAWVVADLGSDIAYAGVGFGFMFFALGAFVFAYGWEGGDIPKAIRLSSIICAIALAAVIALLVLAKTKGSAGKAAAKAGGKTFSEDGLDAVPVINAVVSMFEEEPRTPAKPAPDPAEKLFQIKCRGCGARFAPVPPAARCPHCDEAALAV